MVSYIFMLYLFICLFDQTKDCVCQKVLMNWLECIYTSLQQPHLFICLLITQIVELAHPQFINLILKPVRFHRTEIHMSFTTALQILHCGIVTWFCHWMTEQELVSFQITSRCFFIFVFFLHCGDFVIIEALHWPTNNIKPILLT